MKISCNREQLARVFSSVSAVVPSRAPLEVLRNVKLVAQDGSITLHATDNEHWILAPLADVEVARSGKCLLPSGRVGQMLQEMTGETVVIEIVDTTVYIKCDRCEFKLPSANPDEYPSVLPWSADKYHEVPARVFAEAIKRTEWATDPDSSRFALGGVLVVLEQECHMVGTDGRRLAHVQFGGQSVGGHDTRGYSTIVPVLAAKLLQRALADGQDNCRIAVSQSHIIVEHKGLLVGSRLVEGRFPNWRQVVPARNENWSRVSATAGQVHAVVTQAAIVADQETRGLDFTFRDGTLIAGAQATELGQSTIEMPIEFDGEPIRVKLDHRFVRDFLRVLRSDELFSIDIVSGTQPVVLSVEGYEYVVMPMALE